jgi:O-antigen/teichoic acid export membrane protein
MSLKSFIKNFIKRKGISVGISSLVEKVGGFLLVIIATRVLSKSDFGLLTYANTTLVFLIPFIGFGVHQALIRYGALANSQLEKRKLFIFTLKRGLLFSVIITLFVLLSAPFLTINIKGANIYLLILSFQFVSLFIFEMIRIYSRLLNLNKLYAQITNLKTIFLVLLAFLLSISFGSIGFAIALTIAPLLISLIYLKKLKLIGFNERFQLNIPFKKFFLYGLYTSLGGVLSQLLYAIDILMIGNIVKDETIIALYKVSNIIPFSLLILPVIFIKTDFVLIANKSRTDKKYIKNYYLNYLKLFSVISGLFLLLFYFFSSDLMLLFGTDYQETSLMKIFVIGVVGALLFRIPLGNILSAVGLAKINAINSLVILILNCIFSYIFILKYGAIGAAIVTASLMWFSGFLSLFFFIKFIKK